MIQTNAPSIARLEAVVTRLERASLREQRLLRRLLVAVFVFAVSLAIP